MVLDRLAERAGLTGHAKSRDASATMRGRYNGMDLVLVKPMTYMNESGVAVRKVLARERVPLDDLLVVVDDFDLPLGKLRIREQGSAGTHNGLRSIVGELGNQKFARLRVGIGEPSTRRHRPCAFAFRAATSRRRSRRGARCRRGRGRGLGAQRAPTAPRTRWNALVA